MNWKPSADDSLSRRLQIGGKIRLYPYNDDRRQNNDIADDSLRFHASGLLRPPLKPESAGVVERDGVRMEKILIQTHPNRHVPLLVYRSADAPPGKRLPGMM